MIHGLDMAALREAAKLKVQAYFVARAEEDQTPPTLRAMYAIKLREAQSVLAGGRSTLIEEEAAIRAIPALELAARINAMAAPSNELELARMRVNVRIEAATSPGEISRILAELDLHVSVPALVTLGSNSSA